MKLLFTGIIEETGRVESIQRASHGATVAIISQRIAPSLTSGDSVAANGVCLTVIRSSGVSFSCQLSSETLARTSFGQLREGMLVNLERPLAVGSRLGGHFVQGHVDGIGTLAEVTPSGEGSVIQIEFSRELERYLVYKGSIAVDGISLTIASLETSSFTAAVIAHTLQATNLRSLRVGDVVNLEVDVLGKYVERFLQLGLLQKPGPKLTVEYLKEKGF